MKDFSAVMHLTLFLQSLAYLLWKMDVLLTVHWCLQLGMAT